MHPTKKRKCESIKSSSWHDSTTLDQQSIPQVALLLESSHEISRGMLRGILNYVRLNGPWVLHLDSGGADDQKMPDLSAWKGSGIIARIPNPTVAADIISADLPTVLIDPIDTYLAPSHPLSHCSRIQCDSQDVAQRAADYLLANDFKNFAFVGEPTGMNWSRWREASFVKQIKNADLHCDVYPGTPSDESVPWEIERPQMCRWLSQLPKPTAVFAANDTRARQVLNACLWANLPVPYEVAVLGVNNDVMICETSLPPLSSIAVDVEQAGFAAAQLLDQMMRHEVKTQQCLTYAPQDVVTRASSQRLQVSDPLVIRSLEFIRIHGGLDIRVSDIAEHAGVSVRWLEKRFSETIGRSVLAEIHRLRIETVRSLVSNTRLPFTEIAHRCGFTSANHLGVLFRKEFGTTMSKLRHLEK